MSDNQDVPQIPGAIGSAEEIQKAFPQMFPPGFNIKDYTKIPPPLVTEESKAAAKKAKEDKAKAATPEKDYSSAEFPLLSKSKGFQQAMKEADVIGLDKNWDDSKIPPQVRMQRQLNVMESSDFYQQADPAQRIRMQTSFYRKYVLPTATLHKEKVSLQDWLTARGRVWLQQHPNPNIDPHDSKLFGLGGPRVDKAEALEKGPIGKWLEGSYEKESERSFWTGGQILDAAAQELDKWGTGMAYGPVHWAAGLLDDSVNAVTDLHQKWINMREQVGAANATLTAQLTPHMGPINLSPEHNELRRTHVNPKLPGLGMKLDDMVQASDYADTHYWQNTLGDAYFRMNTHMVGDAIAIGALDGLASGLGVNELLGLDTYKAKQSLNIASPFRYKLGQYFLGMAQYSTKAAVDGYLYGATHRGETGKEDAKRFALMTAGGYAVGVPIISGLGKAGQLIGRTSWFGGPNLIRQSLARATSAATQGQPQAQVTSIAVQMGGSQIQKFDRAFLEAINEITGGKFWDNPLKAQQEALKIIAEKQPEIASKVAELDEGLVKWHAEREAADWRSKNPDADAMLKQMEGESNTTLSQSIFDEMLERERAQNIRNDPTAFISSMFKTGEPPTGYSPETKSTQRIPYSDQITMTQNIIDNLQEKLRRQIVAKDDTAFKTQEELTRAQGNLARIKEKSLQELRGQQEGFQFGENFDKHMDEELTKIGLGPDRGGFENRGEKLVFFLNLLASRLKQEGPKSVTKAETDALRFQLNKEFPNLTSDMLVQMSDKVWSDVGKAREQGIIKSDTDSKIWEQPHLEPGQSPFAHEIESLRKAADNEPKPEGSKKEESKAEDKKVEDERKAKELEEQARQDAEEQKKIKEELKKKIEEELNRRYANYVDKLLELGYNLEQIKSLKDNEEGIKKIIEGKIKPEDFFKKDKPKIEPRTMTEDDRIKIHNRSDMEDHIKQILFPGKSTWQLSKEQLKLAEDITETALSKKMLMRDAIKDVVDVQGGLSAADIPADILRKATNIYFPGKEYFDVPPFERLKIRQLATALTKGMEKKD